MLIRSASSTSRSLTSPASALRNTN
jgi:hypothetical protein